MERPWDPDERRWRHEDGGGYDPAKDGPEAQMHRDRARRAGYGADMDDRRCEKEPARCARCGAAQRLEYRAQYQSLLAMLARWETVITTPWPVAICANGHREEL